MGIRVKPHEIDIPESDPFQNDLLGRKEPVEILTQLIGSLEGPAVLSVDAAWGNGKTTFLKIWAKHLRNQEFSIVEFNAWETDYSGDPFLALSERITNGLEDYSDKSVSLKKKINNTKRIAEKVLRHAVPAIIRVATAGILDISAALEKELGQTLASIAKDRLTAYEETQKSVKEFRASLQDMADELWKEDHPLVVMIDELDRCRPSYAVELLEVAKHLFSADRIAFVLAVNRSELAHSIQALYGDGFDAQGYLGRFFDIDFRLPEPDRKAFVTHLTHLTQIDNYFDRTLDELGRRLDRKPALDLLQDFFGMSDLSLRQVAQAIHHLGLVLASLRSDERSFAVTTVVALILRSLVPASYYEFCRGDISDHQLVSGVLNRRGMRTLRGTASGAVFEAAIVASAFEISQTHDLKWSPSSSMVWDKYEKMQGAADTDETVTSEDRKYARDVIHGIGIFRERYAHDGTVGFAHSVRRIELLSPGLLRDLGETGRASS